MEAQSVERIPRGEVWQYEPKWDGFRCLVFRDCERIELQLSAQAGTFAPARRAVELDLRGLARPAAVTVDAGIGAVPAEIMFHFGLLFAN